MQAQLRQRFARLEFEIFDDEIAFGRPGPLGDLTLPGKLARSWTAAAIKRDEMQFSHYALTSENLTRSVIILRP